MKRHSVIKLPFPELLYPYSPVAKPMPPPPIERACEGDLVYMAFSCSLVPYLLGLLELYRYKDSFTGTDEQKTIAVGVMRELMEIIAMSPCGCSDDIVKIKRINPETGQVEESTDDGVTWKPSPTSPYVQAVRQRPLQGEDGEVKRCEGANNAVENLKDVQKGFSDNIGTANSIIDMLAQIIVIAAGALFLGLVGAALSTVLAPLVGKLIDVARQLTNTTQAAYDALFTNDVWDEVRCILYCNISDDGTFTDAAVTAIMDKLKTELGSGAQDAGSNLAAMVDVWQTVGLNNAAATGSGIEGNCDDCPCGDENCGFSTTQHQNRDRWDMATELVDATIFNLPIGLDKTAGDAAFKALGNQILAADTWFEESCRITTVNLYTLGRGNSSSVTVAYWPAGGSGWVNVGTQTFPSWNAGVAKVFNINADVMAIKIQSKAANSGQQNISSVVISDPTP